MTRQMALAAAAALLASTSSSGCSTPELSKAAIAVEELKGRSSCKVLGVVETSGSWQGTPAKDREAAIAKVRNKVIERGGDAFRVIAEPDDLSAAYVRAEVLRCAKPKPPPKQSKQSRRGESCTRSADCSGDLRCIKQVCVDPDAAPNTQPTSRPASQPADPQ